MRDVESETGILVQDAYKSFRDICVLRKLQLNVPKGTIYSLLGPSGCGKTTLLSCIVGLEKLSSGYIKLHSDNPSLIGYMPQDISLHPFCTVKETFNFYGMLYGLNSTEIKSRTEKLMALLKLQSFHLRISELSGGEQRRMSLAVTMFHDPEIILLDEPTVGLDPVLHDELWKYLLTLTNYRSKTIIITTHYIEEARKSHRVGFMRNGSILEEAKPDELMRRMNCDTLEDVFRSLCRNERILENVDEKPLKIIKSSPPLKYVEYFNYNRFKAQLEKNYIWTRRNFIIMFFLLILPASQSFLFCWCFGRYPKTLAMGFYTEEPRSYPCIPNPQMYYDDGFYNCTLLYPMSCLLSQRLEQSMSLVRYDNYEDGYSDSVKNKIWGIIHVGQNFTESLLTKINMGLNTFEEDIYTSAIDVRMDLTSYVVSHHLRKLLLKGMEDALFEVTSTCGIPQQIGKVPIQFNKPFYEGDSSVGAGSELSGFISGFCFYFGLMFTAGALLNEKLSGVLNRNIVAGLTLVEIVAAHMVVQTLLLTLQASLMILICYYYFEYTISGSPILVMAILYTVGFVGVALGVLLTNLFKSSLMQSYAVIGATIAAFNLGGVIWPQEGMSWILNSWIWAFPTIPAVDSFRAVAAKGQTLSSPTVYIGFLSCIAWILIFIGMTMVVVKYKKSI